MAELAIQKLGSGEAGKCGSEKNRKQTKENKQQIAEVDPEFCNGCAWCFADCPYEAIVMKQHDYKKGHRQAVVIADNCVSRKLLVCCN